jgi:phosphatidylinositol alpha-1,6-mannosyltransferase
MPATLILTNDFPPRIGGIESFVADIAELLDRDVVVYTSGPPGAAASDTARGYPVIRDGSLLLPSSRLARRTASVLRHFGATRVIFGSVAPLGLLAPRLRTAGAEAIVGLTHGHETWWAAMPGARAALRRIGDECDHLTAISGYTARRIGAALSASARPRLLRLPPPIDVSRFAPGEPMEDRARCVAVGRFVAQKGFATLLRAWRLVVDAGPAPAGSLPRPQLTMIGDGPERVRLEAMISRLGLADSVRLTGAISRPEVLAELRRAQVFALPVRTRLGGLNPEGLGLAAIEAAACALPVIVGDSGGAPETVRDGETGFVVPAEDHRALADRICGLLADPDRARAMGARGRAHVSTRFGADKARHTLRRALRLSPPG